MDRRSRPPVSPDSDFDPAMALAFHLAALREAHDLDVIVVADLEGAPLSSAGEADAARALSAFAAAVLRGRPVGTARTYHCGKIHVALVPIAGKPCAVAAKATFLVLDAPGLVEALAGLFELPKVAALPEVEADDLALDDLDWGDPSYHAAE